MSGGNQTPHAPQSSNTASKPVQPSRPSTSEVLEAYEIEVAKCINYGISLKDYVVRKKLDSLRNTLGISLHEAEAIEVRLSENNQVAKSLVNASSPPPVQPKYRRDSVASKIPQANPVKTLDNSQPNFNNPPQQFLEAVNSIPEVEETTQQRFWLMWTLAYTSGIGLGWFISNLLFSNLDSSNTFFNLIRGATVGFALGGVQWLLLRHVSHRMKLWILLTTVSYATSYAMATTLFAELYDSGVPVILIESLYGIVMGGTVGLAQWFVLRPLFQQSKTWFVSVSIAETLGYITGWGITFGAFFGPIYDISSSFTFNITLALLGLISGGVTGAISGLITGRVMVRLLRIKRVQ